MTVSNVGKNNNQEIEMDKKTVGRLNTTGGRKSDREVPYWSRTSTVTLLNTQYTIVLHITYNSELHQKFTHMLN